MENILVSIIMASLNSEKHISEAIESVLRQTYKYIELIIVDGLSTDNTISIIKNYEPKFNGRLQWISEKDSGIYDAINKGITLSKGDLIGVFSSDDLYEVSAITDIVEAYTKGKYDFIYGSANIINENGEFLCEYPTNNDFSEYKFGENTLCHQSAFIKREVYINKVGLYNLKYKMAADYDYFLKCKDKGLSFHKISNIICIFRFGGSSNTYSKQSIKETFCIMREHGCKLTTIMLLRFRSFFYTIYGVIKQCKLRIKG